MLLTASLRRAARRPLRTLLTVLEVALGALAVTVALNLVQGRSQALLPPDVFRVVAGKPGENGNGSFTYSLFERGDLARLKAVAPDVAALEVYGQVYDGYLEVGGERYRLLGAARVGPAYPGIEPLHLTQGAFFGERDLKDGAQPMVIAEGVARALFPNGDALGKSVDVRDGYSPPGGELPPATPHRVVGVFRDPPRDNFGNAAFVFLPPKSGASEASLLAVRAAPGRSDAARAQLLRAVRSVYKDRPQFTGQGGAVYATTSASPFGGRVGPDPTLVLFSAFAAVMLVACSIGVFSIQQVDIAERTREIGMRRALGATRARILAEFLLDAALLSGGGALLGVALAAAALPLLQRFGGQALFSRGLTYSPMVALEVLALVLLVGVLFGAVPAWRAARLKPVQALREA